jgi:hypothetical protein
VVTPKAKANKTTQVSVNEILQETNFLSAFLCLDIRRRKRYLKINVEKGTSVNNSNTPNRGRSFSDGAIFGQRQDASEDEFEDCFRQSTIDSGIAEEKQSKTEAFQFRRNLSRRLSRQNGHTKVHRKPYQWHIDLDPKLIMSGSNTDSQSDDNDQKGSFERRRASSHGGSTSFSDSEITSFVKRKRRKRRKFGTAIKLSSCVTRFRHSRGDGINSSTEGALKDTTLPENENRNNRPMDVAADIIEFKRCVVSAKNGEDASRSYSSDISIGVDDEDRSRLLNDVQSFIYLSQSTHTIPSGTAHTTLNSTTHTTSSSMTNTTPSGTAHITPSNTINTRIRCLNEAMGTNLSGDTSQSSNACTSPEKIFYSSKELMLSEKQDKRYISAICHFADMAKQRKKYTSSLLLQPANDNYHEETRGHMGIDFERSNDLLEEITEDLLLTCTAEGAGLTTGQVGMKNNFQVTIYIFQLEYSSIYLSSMVDTSISLAYLIIRNHVTLTL